MTDVAANYRKLLDQIAEAAARAGRVPNDVKLLAAAKSQVSRRYEMRSLLGVDTLRDAMRKAFKDPDFHCEYKKLTGEEPDPLMP